MFFFPYGNIQPKRVKQMARKDCADNKAIILLRQRKQRK